SPFDARGQGLVFSVGPAKPEPAQIPVPPPRQTLALPERQSEPVRSAIPFPAESAAAGARLISPSGINARPRQTNTSPSNGSPSNGTPSLIARPAAASVSNCPEAPPLLVGLTSLAEGWPETVRQEIVQL